MPYNTLLNTLQPLINEQNTALSTYKQALEFNQANFMGDTLTTKNDEARNAYMQSNQNIVAKAQSEVDSTLSAYWETVQVAFFGSVTDLILNDIQTISNSTPISEADALLKKYIDNKTALRLLVNQLRDQGFTVIGVNDYDHEIQSKQNITNMAQGVVNALNGEESLQMTIAYNLLNSSIEQYEAEQVSRTPQLSKS